MSGVNLHREWKTLYEKLTVSSNIAVNVLRDYQAGTTKVYGEALPNLVHFLIKHMQINRNDIFYDIGSGEFAMAGSSFTTA